MEDYTHYLITLLLASDIEHGTSHNVRCKIYWSAQSKNVLYEYGVQTEFLHFY